MKRSTEKKIEKAMGKRAAKNIEKEVRKEVDKEVEERVERVEEDIKKEVEKRLHIKLYEGTKKSAWKFQKEFKKQMVVAISAAFGFLIALSWRTPLQNLVAVMSENLGLTKGVVYFEFLAAIIITILAVLGLMAVSKWSAGD